MMIYCCDLGMTPFLSFTFSLSHSSTYRQITLTGVAESVRVRGRSRAGEKKKGGTHGFSSCTRRFQLLPVDTVCTEDLRRLDRSQTDYIVSRGYVALATQRIILLHLPVILVSCSPNQCTYDRQTQTHDRDRCKSYLKIIS